MTPPPNLAQQSARFDLQRALRKMLDTYGEEARAAVLAAVAAVLPEPEAANDGDDGP